ncbi:hypothetical protein TARUN_4692 [Trichoderma arundinaceum]|uniref:Helicase ATP-binding domain-containing protein n=1 Tax=Trichoderma arundinaceum TaxID=490622 RepID=A0A395NN80_TRIAR|nr:hypothetical protein TARUN_4692 [Trichoderma arundinaceum]
MRRPDVVFMPEMMGPDGMVQHIAHSRVEMPLQLRPETPMQAYHEPTSPSAYPSNESAGPSPRPYSCQSSSITDGETQHHSDAEQSDAASLLLSTEFAIPDETMIDCDATSLSLEGMDGNIRSDDDTEIVSGTQNADDMNLQAENAEDFDAENAKDVHDRDPTAQMQDNLASDGTPCDVIDLTASDDYHICSESSPQQQNSGASPALQLLYKVNALKPDELDDMCDFFLATPDDIQSGLVIPGTGQKLTLPQLAFIFQTLNKSINRDEQPQGQLLADITGMGKTHCAMGLAAVARLLMLSRAHILNYPELHSGKNSSPSCPAGDPYGIQCMCVAGSLSSKYVARLVGGPLLILSPGHLVEQWVVRAADYFLPKVTPHGSQEAETFVELLSWSGGQLVNHQFAEPGSNAVLERNPFPPSKLTVKVTAEPSTLTASIVKAAIQDVDSARAVRRLRDKTGIKFIADTEAAREADQSRFVVMISANVFSQAKGLAQAFRTQVELHHSTRKSAATLQFPLSIAPSLIVFDECHSIKDEKTQFWSQLMDIHQLDKLKKFRTQWLLISATPVSDRPSDLLIAYRALSHTPEQAQRNISALTRFNGIFLKIQSLADSTEEAKR